MHINQLFIDSKYLPDIRRREFAKQDSVVSVSFVDQPEII